MTPLSQALNDTDRKHLKKILDSSGGAGLASTQLRESVEEFLREYTFVEGKSLQGFQELNQGIRERLISALVWRITCFIDGSVTSVKGVHAHDVGAGFLAVQSRRGKGEIFCLRIL